MRPPWLTVLITLSLLSAACGFGGTDNTALKLTPTPDGRVQGTVVAEEHSVPTITATAVPQVTPTLQATRTPQAAMTLAPPPVLLTPTPAESEQPSTPTPDSPAQGQSKGAQQFARRLHDAVFALERLPGYTYTVTHSSMAPGLVLQGRVASQDKREWTVYEQGFPSHVVARWVVIDDQAYADITGSWEPIDEVPFDTGYPISFGKGYSASLFEPDGTASAVTREDTRVASRTATRYDVERTMGDGFGEGGPPTEGASSATETDSLWVAKDGSYLLRYQGSELFDGSEAAARVVEVTPLNEAPKVVAPNVGSAVFQGNPPPWRAAAIGWERLRSLKSYAVKASSEEGNLTMTLQGEVSDAQGHVSGVMPDFVPVFQDFDPDNIPDRKDIKTVKLEVIYKDKKLWASIRGGEWHRVTLDVIRGAPEYANAFTMLALLPGGPPEDVLDERFTGALEESVFGLRSVEDAVLSRGRLVGTEIVNGVRSLHYEGQRGGNSTDEPVDVWLAANGLYLVRRQATPPGVPEDPYTPPQTPEDVQPEMTRVDILRVNQPITVDPPGR